MDLARLALAGARPYVAAAANTGGGQAIKILQLIDKALAELKPVEPIVPRKSEPEGQWEPPGGWNVTPEKPDA